MIRPTLALLTLALVPATASADTYCVQKPSCSGTDVPAGLQAALNMAVNHAGPDRVEIGPTPSPLTGTFSYTANEPLDIVGAGIGVTRLAAPNVVNSSAMVISGPQPVTVSDLSVELPALDGARGLYLGTSVTADRVEVKGVAGTENAFGIYGGATIRNAKVSIPGASSVGISLDQNGKLLENSDVTAAIGVRNANPNTTNTIRGGSVTSTDRALDVEVGTLVAEDVAVTIHGPGRALFVADGNNNSGVVTLDARHVTVRTDDAAAYGALVYNSSPTESAVLHLRDSVITGPGHSLSRGAFKGSASIDTDYSDYPAYTPADSSGSGTLTEAHHLTAPAALDANGVPTAASPLLDAGTPGALGAGERITDAVGKPRFVAATGCDARRDIGAFEFQPAALTAVASAAATAKAGEDVAYSSAGSCDPDPSAALVFSWSFDDGTVATGASPTHAWSTGGTHVATVTVTGGGGRTGTATASVDVTAPPVVTVTPTVTPSVTPTVAPTVTPGPLDRTVPVLSKLSRRVFTLSEAATVKLTLRRGHHKARRLTVKAPAGKTTFRLRARRPGRYRLTATPTDTVGNHGKTVRLRFRIRR